MLLSGRCRPNGKFVGYSEADYILITIRDIFGYQSFPPQSWPVAQGRFKTLVLLTSGPNSITLEHRRDLEVIGRLEFKICYAPLIQLPPLHLAIMVAKDSPLVIDCPHSKQRGISSAHADLDAAIAKLRMTASMWQAMTAEDMRLKGLGRRSFRLEEEWGVDTTSRQFINNKHSGDSAYNESGLSPMRSTAKVHIVHTDKTVAELRDVDVAQQNEHGSRRDELHQIFSSALKAYGGPFQWSSRPVVAGLILDSTYSTEKDMILAHAALGSHNHSGLSLAIFGSHLTFSWPRFLEEVPACLLDTTPRDGCIGNDNGECLTAWEACAVSQGAFLHEVGHAFGAGHTTGIMARGYSPDWTKNFLPFTAYSAHKKSAGTTVEDANNNARWALCDALRFRNQPHFRQPSDKALSLEAKNVSPSVQLVKTDDGAGKLEIDHPAGIARVTFNDVTESSPSVSRPQKHLEYSVPGLDDRFDPAFSLRIQVTAMNGKERVIRNLWKPTISPTEIHISCSPIVLEKQSIAVDDVEDSDKSIGNGPCCLIGARMMERVGHPFQPELFNS